MYFLSILCGLLFQLSSSIEDLGLIKQDELSFHVFKKDSFLIEFPNNLINANIRVNYNSGNLALEGCIKDGKKNGWWYAYYNDLNKKVYKQIFFKNDEVFQYLIYFPYNNPSNNPNISVFFYGDSLIFYRQRIRDTINTNFSSEWYYFDFESNDDFYIKRFNEKFKISFNDTTIYFKRIDDIYFHSRVIDSLTFIYGKPKKFYPITVEDLIDSVDTYYLNGNIWIKIKFLYGDFDSISHKAVKHIYPLNSEFAYIKEILTLCTCKDDSYPVNNINKQKCWYRIETKKYKYEYIEVDKKVLKEIKTYRSGENCNFE